MARADYRLCDKCEGKAFYDATLDYDFRTYPDTGLWNLGDWTVLCRECANGWNWAARTEYKRLCDQARAEARAEYERVRDQAWAEYERMLARTFARLICAEGRSDE